MKLIFRTVAILAVAMLIVGAAMLLNSNSASGLDGRPLGQGQGEFGQGRGQFDQGQDQAQAGEAGGFPGGGFGEGGGRGRGPGGGGGDRERLRDRDGGGQPGAATVVRSLLVVAVFTLIGALLVRGIKALNRFIRRRALNPTPSA